MWVFSQCNITSVGMAARGTLFTNFPKGNRR